jgi:hypothetical protein
MTDVNPVATAIAALTGKASNMIERKKGSIMGMHEIALKHQLDHENFLHRTAAVHSLAAPGSRITLDAGKGVKATYTKAGKAAAAKKTAAKKPAVSKAPAAKKPATTARKTAANTKNPTVTSTVPIKNQTRMSTRAGGRR